MTEVPAGSEFDQARDDTRAELPEPQETPDAGDVARIEAPEPDDLSMIDTEATASAAQPETGDSEVTLNAPETGGDAASGIAVDTETPVLPTLQANAPEAPVSEEELSISTEPAQPALPDVPEEETAFATPDEPATEGTEAAAETAVSDSAAAEPEEETKQSVEAPSESAADPGATATTDSTETVEVQETVVEPSLPVIEAPDTAPEGGAATPATPDQDVAAPAEQAEPTEPGGQSGTIDNIADNVTTGRLPSVTAEEPAVPDETADAADPADQGTASDDADLPPVQRFATGFENPDGKPLMSIVLIDDGSSPIGLDALRSFPYPLSFAVDAGWSGAGSAMQKYRGAGFEVLAMVDLPEGQTASDIEVSMQTYLERVPQAVAVMEGVGRGLQAGREASEQIADILRDSGHGAVLFSNGLNTAQKLIAREGVPSASVFRDFDSGGQSATVIRRFLDQAAFRAGQEDKGVIVVGRLRADTISALLLWGLQDRASRVAVAPVSAVLTAE